MERIVKILMNRDGMSREEAVAYYKDVMDEVNYYVEDGLYEYAEQAFESGFGLELDYFPLF